MFVLCLCKQNTIYFNASDYTFWYLQTFLILRKTIPKPSTIIVFICLEKLTNFGIYKHCQLYSELMEKP